MPDRKYTYLLLVLTLLFSTTSFGQRKKFDKSKEFGIMAGTSYYIGDLNPDRHFGGDLTVGAGAMYRQNLDMRWSIKGQFFYGQIAASDAQSDDAWQQNRNLSFRNQIMEGSVTVELNYTDYQIGNRRESISPYLFLGLAYYSHKPQAQYNGQWFDLQPLGTEGQGTSEGGDLYALNGVAIPFGVGLKVNLFSIVALSAEWGMRKTYSDYLDDVSGVYANPTVLEEESGTLTAILADRSLSTEGDRPNNAGFQRGDSGRRDFYSFTTLTLSIRLGKPPTTCWNQ